MFLLLFGLLVPATAWAVKGTPGDGTLSVRNGDGQIRLSLERGVAIGRIGDGTLTVIDPVTGDCDQPLVWDDGERAEPITKEVVMPTRIDIELRCIYKGDNMRFRLNGADADRLMFVGTSIGLSVVGKGTGRIKGSPLGLPDGTYAVNGEEYASLPDDWKGFQLAAANPAA
jgi:hypothetical protein